MPRIVLALMLLAAIVAPTNELVKAVQTTNVVFTFAAGVSAEDEALIREGVRFAEEMANERLGRSVERPFRVDVRPRQELDVPGSVGNDVLYLGTDHPVWVESPPMRRLKIVVHEYFHLLQLQSIRRMDAVPKWLIEGSAELFAFEAVSRLGLADWTGVVDHWIFAMFNDPSIAGVPLEAMEHPVPEVACCLYSVTPLAVRELVPDGDWSAFLDYLDEFDLLPPDETFSKMFGQSLPDFYAHFAAARQQMSMSGGFPEALKLPWYPVD